MNPGLLVRREGSTGRLTFDGPRIRYVPDRKLVGDILHALNAWSEDEGIELVLIEQAQGVPSFFAGRDFETLFKSSVSLGGQASEYLKRCYQLHELVANYPKPIVSLIEGEINGFGLGIGLNSEFKVVSERAVLSFPETGIGFIPDGGTTWHLANLPGELGTFLALTGSRLNGDQLAQTGLASHFCPARDMEDLKCKLVERGLAALNRYKSVLCTPQQMDISRLNKLFEGDDINAIIRRIESSGVETRSLATKIKAKSGLSIKLVLRLLRTNRYFDSVREALKLEFRIATRLINSHDFREGVRAHIIDRDFSPKWHPKLISKVNYDLVAGYFSPLPTGELEFIGGSVSGSKSAIDALAW